VFDRRSRRPLKFILLSAIKAVVAVRRGFRLISAGGRQLALIRAPTQDLVRSWIAALLS
jgi:hypothetical protein